MAGFMFLGLMLAVALYVMLAKAVPAMQFQYRGRGEREARAAYVRIRRENPDSSDARLTEPEFVEKFIREGPKPWRYVLASGALLLLGLPASCVVGLTSTTR